MYENLNETIHEYSFACTPVLWSLPVPHVPVSVILRHIESDRITQQGKAALARPNHVGSAPLNIREATLPTRNVTSTFTALQLVC